MYSTRKIPDNKKKSSFNTEKKKKNSAITQKAQKIRQLEKSTSIFFFSLLQKNMQDFLQKIWEKPHLFIFTYR